jgi:hypothetical protein
MAFRCGRYTNTYILTHIHTFIYIHTGDCYEYDVTQRKWAVGFNCGTRRRKNAPSHKRIIRRFSCPSARIEPENNIKDKPRECVYVYVCMYIVMRFSCPSARTEPENNIKDKPREYMHTCLDTYVVNHLHTYIHTYTHTQRERENPGRYALLWSIICIHTYIHIYIHTYIHTHRALGGMCCCGQRQVRSLCIQEHAYIQGHDHVLHPA